MPASVASHSLSSGTGSVTGYDVPNSDASFFTRIKPAIFKLLSSLVKDDNENKTSAVTVFVEFLQLLAFAFVGPWGKSGNELGNALLWTQIENRIMAYDNEGVNVAMVVLSLFLIFLMIALAIYNVNSLHKSEFSAGVGPLRMLRYLVSLLSSILFLPIIAPLLKGIHCKVLSCSSTGGLVITILSGIGVALFVPFTLFMSLTYFNPNSKAQSFLGRPNALLEFFEVTVKFVLMSVFIFTHDGLSLGVASLVCYSGVAGYLYLFTPYFNAKVTYYRFCLTGVLMWSSVVQIGVSVANMPAEGIAALIAWAVVVPGVAYISFKTIKRRQDFAIYGLYNRIMKEPGLPKATNETNVEDVYEFFTQVLKKTKFLNPAKVEVATRFLATKHSVTDLALARAIFERGLELFPKSPSMNVLNGIFSGIWMTQIHQWKISLKKAQEFNPNFITEFLIYQQLGELRVMAESKITGKSLNMVDSLELRHLVRRTKKLHSQANTEILHFWKLLSGQKVDMNRVQHTVSKLTYLEEAGVGIFENLRKKYPKDPRVLLAYARFQDDIVKNYKKAELLYALSDINNNETTTAEASTHSNHSGNSGSDSPSHENVDNKSASSGASGANHRRRQNITRKEIKQYLEFRTAVIRLRPSAAKRSICLIAFVIVLCIALAVGEAIWVSMTVSQVTENIQTIRTSGTRREAAVILADRMRTQEFLIKGGPQTEGNSTSSRDEYARLSLLTSSDVKSLYNTQMKLFFSGNDKGNAPSYRLWLYPSEGIFNNLTLWNKDSGIWTPNGLNMFDASSEFGRHARDAANSAPSVYYNGSNQVDPNFRFVMDNFAYTYGDGYNNATAQYILESESSIEHVLTSIIGAFGGVCAVLIFVGSFIFRPMLDNMIKVRKQSLDVVFSIPKTMCTNIYARCQASTLHSEVEDDEEDDEDDEDSINNNSGGASIKVMYTKLTFAYAFGLVLIAGFFGITVGINYGLAGNMKEWGRRIDLTLEIRYRTSRLAYAFREMIGLDPNIYLDQSQDSYNKAIQGPQKAYKNFLYDRIAVDFFEFNDIQFTLLFGNVDRKIHKGRLPIELQEKMFVPFNRIPEFNNGNHTVDELVNYFLEFSMALIETANPNNGNSNVTATDSNFIKIRAIYQTICKGFFGAATTNEMLFDRAAFNLRASAIGLAGLIIGGVLAIYYMVFRSLISFLTKAGLESTKMMLLIPPEASRQNYSLQVLLRGKEGADLFFQENGFEIPTEKESIDVKTVSKEAKRPEIKKTSEAVKITVEDVHDDSTEGQNLKPKKEGNALRRSFNSLVKMVGTGSSEDTNEDLEDELRKSKNEVSIRKSAEVLTRSQTNLAAIVNGKDGKKTSTPKVAQPLAMAEVRETLSVHISDKPNIHTIPSREQLRSNDHPDYAANVPAPDGKL